jgi:hypothetical protein
MIVMDAHDHFLPEQSGARAMSIERARAARLFDRAVKTRHDRSLMMIKVDRLDEAHERIWPGHPTVASAVPTAVSIRIAETPDRELDTTQRVTVGMYDGRHVVAAMDPALPVPVVLGTGD